jgi:prolipoprotein diacylglyceryltransferase
MAFHGSVFLYAVAGYGLGRFVLEATREDRAIVCGISINRSISVTLVAISAALLAVAWPR